MNLKKLTRIMALLFAMFVLVTFNAEAKEDKSFGLYINLSSTDTVKIGHAFAQSIKMQKRGHPVTVFLNGGAILVAVKGVPQTTFMDKSLQKWMLELMHGGGKIIICQVCMKVHKITDADLVEGAVIGNPDIISEYLFDPKYKVISW